MFMNIYVETLAGTSFELRVSPTESVVSVKSKIQRTEGVPIAQQHLLWQNTELDDHRRLRDYGIRAGSSLRLVLGMRGGPLNAHRIPPIRLTPLNLAPTSKKLFTAELRFPLSPFLSGLSGRSTDFNNDARARLRKNNEVDKPELSQQLTNDLRAAADKLDSLALSESLEVEATKPTASSINPTAAELKPLSKPPSLSAPEIFVDQANSDLAATDKANSRTSLRPGSLDRKTNGNSRGGLSSSSSSSTITNACQQPSLFASRLLGYPPLFSSAPIHRHYDDLTRHWRIYGSHTYLPPPPARLRPEPTPLSVATDQDSSDSSPPGTASERAPSPRAAAATSSPTALLAGFLSDLEPAWRYPQQQQPRWLPRTTSLLPWEATNEDDPMLMETVLDFGADESDHHQAEDDEEDDEGYADDLAELEDILLCCYYEDEHQKAVEEWFPTAGPWNDLEARVTDDNDAAAASATDLSKASFDAEQWRRERAQTKEKVKELKQRMKQLRARRQNQQQLDSTNVSSPTLVSGAASAAAAVTASVSESKSPLCQSPSKSSLMTPHSSERRRRFGTVTPPVLSCLIQPPPTSQSMPMPRMSNSASDSPPALAQSHTTTTSTTSSANQLLPSLVSPRPAVTTARVSTSPRANAPASPPSQAATPVRRKRCALCLRKTGLANSYSCRCGRNFCARHRHAESHACPFDYKAEARRTLIAANPVITAPKLPKI